MRTLKIVFQEIAAKRKTNIKGLADMLGIEKHQSLFRRIWIGSFSLKFIRQMITDLELTDEEILEIVKTLPEAEIVETQTDIQEEE